MLKLLYKPLKSTCSSDYKHLFDQLKPTIGRNLLTDQLEIMSQNYY